MKKTTPSHLIIKLLKCSDKEKILKAHQKKIHRIYWVTYIKITVNFLSENNNNNKRQWSSIFNVLKEKPKKQPRVLYLTKISFKNKGDLDFSIENLKEFFTCIIQKISKEVIEIEENDTDGNLGPHTKKSTSYVEYAETQWEISKPFSQ